MKNNKQAILIGGDGFIGSNLNIYLKKSFLNTFVVSSQKKKEKNKIYYKNITELKKLNKKKFYIFYLVGKSLPNSGFKQFQNQLVYEIKTLLFYLKIFDNKNSKWVFISSAGTVYGENKKKNKEYKTDLNPISHYGLIKLISEKTLYLFNQKYKINYSIARLSNPYGPGQLNKKKKHGFIVNLLNSYLSKNFNFFVYNNGEVMRNYIYIDDACEGIYKVAINGKRAEIYNIGHSKSYSLNEIIKISKKFFKKNNKLIFKKKDNKHEVQINILDTSKANKELGFRATTSIYTGIKKTISWLKLNN